MGKVHPTTVKRRIRKSLSRKIWPRVIWPLASILKRLHCGRNCSRTLSVRSGTTTVLIPNGASYIFSVDGAMENDATVQSVNAFKRQPGFGGLVLMDSVCGGNPVPG